MLESIKKEVKGDLENAFLNLGKQVHAHTHTHIQTHTHTPPPPLPRPSGISFQFTVLKQSSNE